MALLHEMLDVKAQFHYGILGIARTCFNSEDIYAEIGGDRNSVQVYTALFACISLVIGGSVIQHWDSVGNNGYIKTPVCPNPT